MSVTLAALEAKIKSFEHAIAQSLANHNALLGGLQTLQSLLGEAKSVLDVMAPSSSADAAVGTAESAAAVASAVIENIEPTSASTPAESANDAVPQQ